MIQIENRHYGVWELIGSAITIVGILLGLIAGIIGIVLFMAVAEHWMK